MAVTEVGHRRYRLRAGRLGDRFVARAFLAGARGIVMEREGKGEAAALESLREALDARDAARRDARRHDGAMRLDVPTAEEYGEALDAVAMSDAVRAMLRAHAQAGPEGLSTPALARVAGYRSHEAVNLHYGRFGFDVAAFLELPLPPSTLREGENVATGVLAGAGPATPEGHFVWVMHPELRAAVEAWA